jgi:hypothetical protein
MQDSFGKIGISCNKYWGDGFLVAPFKKVMMSII